MEEQLDVFHAVLQHCDAVDAHAEGESRDLLRVVPFASRSRRRWDRPCRSRAIRSIHCLQWRSSVGMPLPPQMKHETCMSALGSVKGKKTDGLHARTEQRFHRVVERALEIAESDVRVHRQSFDLVEHRRVRGIGRSLRCTLPGMTTRTGGAAFPWCGSALAKCACAATDDRVAA